MKKILVLVFALMMFNLNYANAQVVTKKTAHVTKSGAPDKRYKENKVTTKTETKEMVGPTKKDGTPDMRYKANKTKTVSAKTTVTTKAK